MTLAGLLERLEAVPILRALSRVAADRRFESNTRGNLFRGVFDSFSAAEAAAPPTRPHGYDNEESAALYVKRLEIDDYDYPALLWMSDAFANGMRTVADIGGAVGIKYFAFGNVLTFPRELVWRVIDVPAVVQRGRAFAEARGTGPSLQFSGDLADASGVDVFFASGALQYLPLSLAEILDRLPVKPRRIIVNTTPIHDTDAFFTVNSIGTAFCPYRVQQRGEFVQAVTSRGYQLRDQWTNVGKRMKIPLEPQRSLSDYSGFCFDREAAGA